MKIAESEYIKPALFLSLLKLAQNHESLITTLKRVVKYIFHKLDLALTVQVIVFCGFLMLA